MLLDEAEFEQLRRLAREKGTTVAEWVRQAVRNAAREQPGGATDRKLSVVRSAASHQFPTADIAQMLDEIEQGYQARP